MNYSVPISDQTSTKFLFNVHEHTAIILPKNLDELHTEVRFNNLRAIAKRLNIIGRGHMNKQTLCNEIRNRIIFE